MIYEIAPNVDSFLAVLARPVGYSTRTMKRSSRQSSIGCPSSKCLVETIASSSLEQTNARKRMRSPPSPTVQAR